MVKISYVDVHGSRKVSVIASWSAPGANPYTLAEIGTPAPVNYGGLDETVTLYTVFMSMQASMLRKAQSDISGKINSIRWGCDGREAWLSMNVAPGNANVNAALQSIAKHICPLSNGAKYGATVRTFGVSADKDAFMAAAGTQHNAIESISFLVIGKTSSIKDEVRSKYQEKVNELVREQASGKPAEKGAKRSLDAMPTDFPVDIKLKNASGLLAKIYLSKIFREVEMDIFGHDLVSRVKINIDKAADSDKIKDFAEKLSKSLGDRVGPNLALYGAEHGFFGASELLSVAKESYNKGSIADIVKSYVK